MAHFLLRLFVKNADQTSDPKVRAAVGTLSGIVGILCNFFLFLGKVIIGTLSGSVSITADAMNNLSDAASSIVTLVGFKLAEQPADAEHPYGHARFEYLSGLVGAAMIGFLKPGDKVMICETCSHHPQPDDIGRKKLPRWLEKTVGGKLDIEVVVGKDFPADLTPYKLILQCGGCVVTRRHMLSRVRAAVAQNVPMTNYGVAISYLQGVLERALELHPAAYAAFREAQENLKTKGSIR